MHFHLGKVHTGKGCHQRIQISELCLGAGQYTSYGAHQQPQKREAIQIQGPCKKHNQEQKEMEPKTCPEASDSTHQGHTQRRPGV